VAKTRTLIGLARKMRRASERVTGRDYGARVEVQAPAERFGSDYGGYVVCPDYLTPDSIVYSLGIGEDISFDVAIIGRFGTHVHAFDPTPRSREWVMRQWLPDGLIFHPVGIAGFDGIATFEPPEGSRHVSHVLTGSDGTGALRWPVRRLSSTMQELGHTRIDLLKMDIEGSEYDVIRDIVDLRIDVRQLVAEFHHRIHRLGAERTREALHLLKTAGFKIFHVSDNGATLSLLRTPGESATSQDHAESFFTTTPTIMLPAARFAGRRIA
jgi:FkbM family methyltransferase